MKRVYSNLLLLSAISASFSAGWFSGEQSVYYSLLKPAEQKKKIILYVDEDFSEERKLKRSLEMTLIEKNISLDQIEGIFLGDDRNYYKVIFDIETEKAKITTIESDKQTSAQNPGVF